MAESALVRAIRLEAPKFGVTLFRNNVGMLQDKRGNLIRYGLCVGSSDLIGFARVICDNDFPDPNQMRAIFTAIEAKMPGKKPTAEQLAFIAAVKAAGGIAGVVYSIEDFRKLITGQ